MSRRRRQGLSPSLFPFLAVLVCTLGTLILLLALVAQNATETAEQDARAKQQIAEAERKASENSQAPPRMTAKVVETMISEERFRVAQLVSFRDKQTSDLEQRRDQLTHMEDHLERLRQKLKRLSDEVDNAMGNTAEKIEDEVVAKLRAKIDEERLALDKLRSESADKTPRVVIVPHKGPNGTDRRPVYLECDAQGVTVWPEGSRITLTQLERSTNSANPLDAALRAVRYHALQTYGDTTPPYPLLVVRPDGIDTYGLARKAMLDWDDQFGYELVPAEVKLAYSTPDANLKQRVDIAIHEATANQTARSAIAMRGLGGRSPAGSGLGRRGAAGPDPRPRGRVRTLSAASLDRAGRANGFRSAADDYRAGVSPFGRSPYTAGSQSTSSSRLNPQTPYSGGAYGGSYANMDPSHSTREMADQMRSAAREMRDRRQFGGQDLLSRSTSQGNENMDADRGVPGEGKTLEESARLGVSDRRQSEPSPSDWSQGYGERGESGSQSEQANQDGQLRDPTNGSDTDRQREAKLAQTRSQQNSVQERSGRAARSNASGQSAARGTEANSQNTPSQQPPVSGSPPPSGSSMMGRDDMVRRQGRDWALPPSLVGMRGNSIVRTIRVECHSDRFVLRAPSTGGAFEVFGFSDGDVDRASLELATAVRDRVKRWGPSLPGGRWQPRLDVIIARGSEVRFHQLRTLMSGSGVEVTGRASP